MNDATPLLQVQDLVKHFPVRRGLFGRAQGAVRAVEGVSFELRAGQTLGVVGESGCGKSTLGRLVLRLIDASAGSVVFAGTNLSTLDAAALRAQRRAMQIIFQDPYSSLNPRMTVGQTLAEPLALHGLHTGRHAERVAELLHTVGLPPEHAQRYPHEFSGGQRQRIGIARALAVEPQLIVCDEAVSALDVSVQAQVVNLLQDLQRRLGIAYIFIAHDLAVVKHIASHIAVMYLGRIVEIADKHTLFATPRHPYTQALLSAIPVPEPDRGRAQGHQRLLLQGDVPSPTNPPSGCAFHTRCVHVRERCKQQLPALDADAAAATAAAIHGHRIACHFWREIQTPAALQAPAAAVNTRLQRLQSAFLPKLVT
jgi:oligopeptide/dipeptide ABC transporter ATP-binding protein